MRAIVPLRILIGAVPAVPAVYAETASPESTTRRHGKGTSSELYQSRHSLRCGGLSCRTRCLTGCKTTALHSDTDRLGSRASRPQTAFGLRTAYASPVRAVPPHEPRPAYSCQPGLTPSSRGDRYDLRLGGQCEQSCVEVRRHVGDADGRWNRKGYGGALRCCARRYMVPSAAQAAAVVPTGSGITQLTAFRCCGSPRRTACW